MGLNDGEPYALTTTSIVTPAARVRQLQRWRESMQAEFNEHREFIRLAAELLSPWNHALEPPQGTRVGARDRKIFDPHPMEASDVARSGLMTGLTDPNEPWFELGGSDPRTSATPRAAAWAADFTEASRHVLNTSNVYAELPNLYGDDLDYGHGGLGLTPRPAGQLHTYAHPVGSFRVANDSAGMVHMVYTRVDMTLGQIISEWGIEALSEKQRSELKSSGNKVATRIKVHQIVYPNDEHDRDALDARFKRWRQTYWIDTEGNAGKGHILYETGYDLFPFIVGASNRRGMSPYGIGAAAVARPASAQLQTLTRQFDRIVAQDADPAVDLPHEWEGKRYRTTPGARNIVPKAAQGSSVGEARRSYELNVRLDHIAAKMADLRDQIDNAYHRNLFERIRTATEGRDPTATQIVALENERDSVLAPIMERHNPSVLEPLVTMAAHIAWQAGFIEAPPPELAGQPMRIRYISVIARAQRSRALAPLLNWIDVTSRVAAVVGPEAVDRLEADKTLERLHAATGAHPDSLRDITEAMHQRQARAAQAAQEREAALATQNAAAARDVSQAASNIDPALLGGLSTSAA